MDHPWGTLAVAALTWAYRLQADAVVIPKRPTVCRLMDWMMGRTIFDPTSTSGAWRRERDSNPRWAVNPHTLSRRAT